MASGFFPVQFRDFFITDLVSSMVSCWNFSSVFGKIFDVEGRDELMFLVWLFQTYTFTSMAVLECATRNRFEHLGENCRIDRSWVVPALTAIPAYFRLAQCIRRGFASSGIARFLNLDRQECL